MKIYDGLKHKDVLNEVDLQRLRAFTTVPDSFGKGTRCSTLACTLDIARTVMRQLGGDYRSTFFGRNALHLPPEQGYTLMQHNHDVALLTADQRLVVLDARRQAWVYKFDPQTFALKPESLPPKERVQATAAFFQTAYRLYYDERLLPTLDSASIADAPANGSSAIEPVSHTAPVKRP